MLIDIYDGNNIMRRAYEKHGLMPGQMPMTLRQRFEEQCGKAPGTQIWCWDGHKHNERRREIYPPYKMNREPMAENIFAQIRLWREILLHTPATQITVHGWEADDVIGTIVRKYPGRFRVHTNDMDYGQIAHLCLLNGANLKGVEPRWIPLYKAMVGDKSDNIDGIPGFGPKRWEDMREYWPQIERAILQGNPAGFVGLPFKPAVAAWLASNESIELLQKMLTVTHFQNVPDDELNGGLVVGVLDRMKGHTRLSEFFL